MYLVNTNKIIKYKTIYVLKVMKESNINPCEEFSKLVVHRKETKKKGDALFYLLQFVNYKRINSWSTSSKG